MSGLAKKTAVASSWTVGGKIIARMLDFVTLLILARFLDPADFGLVAIATSILVILETILELPLTPALLRNRLVSKPMLDTAFTLSLMRGLVISIVLAAAAWPVALIYDDARLTLLMMALSIAPAMRSIISPRLVVYMQGFDFRREFAIDVVIKGTSLIFGVATVMWMQSYWALAVAAISGPVAATIVSYVFAPMRPVLTLREWRQFSDIIGWNAFSQILNAINWQIDRLILPVAASLATLGAFAIADSLAGIVHRVFVGPLTAPLVAGFARLEEPQQVAAAYIKATRAITLIAGPVLVVLAVLAEPALRVTVGDSWASAIPLFQGLCIVSLLTLPSAIMPSVAMVLDKTRLVALRMGIEFAVRMPMAIVLVVYFGAAGAIAARLVGVSVGYLVTMMVMRRLIGLPVTRQLAAFASALVPQVPMLAFLFFVEPFLSAQPSGPELFVMLLGAGFVAMAIFWLAALGFWQARGCPAGVEALIVEKMRLRMHRPASV